LIKGIGFSLVSCKTKQFKKGFGIFPEASFLFWN